MSLIQRLMQAILPRAWAAGMENESRAWLAQYEVCRYERSIWELGGSRWKAAGSPRRRLACPRCARTTWHLIHRRTA